MDVRARVRSAAILTPVRAVGIAAILVAVLVHLPSLGQPLLEAHGFRQSQTAFTALLFHEQGIDLLHPKLPVLGAPWEVPLEFPLFQALASAVMDLGADPDVATRATGLVAFVVTAWLTWVLARRTAGERAGLIALAAFLFSPLALLWSRAALIEYLATALALAYVLSALRWLEGRSSTASWAAAAAFGALAMMVKVTTGVLFLVPILVLGAIELRKRHVAGTLRPAAVLGLGLVIALPVGAGLLWTRHADAIKSASEFTVWLASGNLMDWNFGTLAQRLDVGSWVALAGRSNIAAFGGLLAIWTPLTLAGGFRSPVWGIALASVLAVWAGPLVFTNLYYIHDYYLTAISPFIAVGFGIGFAWLARQVWVVRSWRLRGRWLATACLGVWVADVVLSVGYWGVQYRGVVDPEGVLVAARAIDRQTGPDDRVVVTGRDWSPAALYYARRWGLMWREPLAMATSDRQLRHFRDLGYVKILDCPSGQACSVADLRTPRATILEALGVEPEGRAPRPGDAPAGATSR